ncbi:MAG: Flp pilus assembly complex ATPase component TadA [Myxococcales bacterium]|nr:Flp pilus assembly complex ATPase component TadA [Myxococcales bacterium]
MTAQWHAETTGPRVVVPSVGNARTIREALEAVPRAAFARHDEPPRAAAYVLEDGSVVPGVDELGRWLRALGSPAWVRALVVGDGSGYVAAVLAHLASSVVSIERSSARVEGAAQRLALVGVADAIDLRHGDGSAGCRDRAPFDAILYLPTARTVPPELIEQLAPGGNFVAPDPRPGRMLRLVRGEDGFAREEIGSDAPPPRLGDLLVAEAGLHRHQVEEAARVAQRTQRRLGEVILEETSLTETDVYRALAHQRGLPFGDVEGLLTRVDPAVVRAIPRAFLQHNQVVPIARDGSALLVATTDPDGAAPDLAKALSARTLRLHLVTPTDYRRLWSGIDLMGAERPEAPAEPSHEARGDLLEGATVDARFVGLFEALLLDAIGERASDIHLEQYGDRVRVRLRVDGELRDVPRYAMTPAELRGVMNVLKVSSTLDIAERRLPQGGRMRRRAGGRAFDLRVQTQPSLHGEHCVIRLLPQDTRLLTIEDLGLDTELAASYRRLLDHPAGLVLVVGPTGSGKSTTLYAGLQILARDATRKVITVEDPIEYSIDGVQQTQVKPEIGFAFAHAMRAFVRQDPDVILVGEIRDGETALEAVRASQTGHLVFSTLHCNDAVDAVQRLLDLGMHPNSVASELLAVLAQRLARRICDGCRVVARPDPEVLAELWPAGDVPASFRCFVGEGCARCGGHGTYGRIAVVEYLPTGPAIRGGIAHRMPIDELRDLARQSGLRSLRRVAVDLVTRGIIPMSELRGMLSAEHMAG